MTKKTFLNALKQALGDEPEAYEIINYYDELIDEATLSGELEVDVVERLGSVEDIIASLGKKTKETHTSNKKIQKTVLNFSIDVIIKIALVGLSIVLFSFGLTLISSSGINLVAALFKVFTSSDAQVIFYYISQITLSVGFILIGVWLMIKMIIHIRSLVRVIDAVIRNRKEGA